MELLTFISVCFAPKRKKELIINDLSFSINEKDALGVMGKTSEELHTFFKLAAGFEKPNEGIITLDDQVLADDHFYLLPEERKIGIVPKELALFPHLTLAENIRIGLLGTPSSKEIRLKELVDVVDFKGDLNQFPHQTGYLNQLQIAIARALTSNPVLLLLEEPFGETFPSLKPKMHLCLQKIIRKTGCGIVFTTKFLEDALALSNKLLILKNGQVEQFDFSENIYKFPKNEFVMELMEYNNCFKGEAKEDKLETPFGSYELDNLSDSKTIYWMVQPEEILIYSSPTPVEAKVEACIFYGNYYQVNLKTNFGDLIAKTNGNIPHGSQVFLAAHAIDFFILENGKKKN